MKVAIVGTCPSSRMLSQGLPDDWQIWTCAPDNVARLARVDCWFELHGDIAFDWRSDGVNYGPYIAWLNQQTFPIYAYDTRAIPRAKVFPFEEMIKRFSSYWFTSSMAWMMAFAIDQGAEEIGLYGMDMAARSEYGYQKPAIRRFIEFAEERDIKVHAPPQSEVLQPPPMYGYSVCTPMGIKMEVRRIEVENKIAELEAALENTRLKLQHFCGVRDNLDWATNTWTGQPVPAEQKIYKFEVIKGIVAGE